MPTINNATVATGTGLSTAGNGGRKLVRLLNGALVAGYYNSSTSKNIYNKSLDNGNTWTATSNTIAGSPTAGFALATNGTNVYSLYGYGNGGIYFVKVDVNSSNLAIDGQAVLLDSQSSAQAVSLAINDAGTELHAAWSSKNSTYPNSFNIRYAKGTIATDGSVTWGAVEQLSTLNTAGQDWLNPIITTALDYRMVAFEQTTSGAKSIRTYKNSGGGWSLSSSYVYNGSSFDQKNPILIFIPQSINGLANGRLWVSWHGKDATDSAKFNIRTSYSDDGGVTWATPTKQTTGNTYDQTNASITADKNGKVLLYWDGDEDASGNTVTVTKEKIYTGTWGATTSLSGDNHYGVSTLFDRSFSLGMTRAPLIRYYASGVRFTGSYFTGSSVSPLSSALGDKTAPSVLSYTVTPESGSTITSIVEKVNGTTVNTYSNPASLSRTFTIPLTNWDALKYYNTHTISVTVTDSNGMSNTQTYTFNKTLANDASLLEGTKAAKDGKDRISTKRDVLAGQVGLAAGSTFDAISAQLASGNAVVKRQTGTATSTTATIGGYNYVTIPFSAIGFVPKSISIQRASNTAFLAHCNVDSYFFSATKYYSFTNNFGELLDGTSWYVNESGVQLAIGASLNNVAVKWIAYG